MTNQVNQYERHMAIQEAYQIHDSDEYFKARPQLECGDRRKVFYAGHIRGYQAATQASEIEINSLNERVNELQIMYRGAKRLLKFNTEKNPLLIEIAELTASNNKLREALEESTEKLYGSEYLVDVKQAEINIKVIDSTPAQSLAEHDNEIINHCADTALYWLGDDEDKNELIRKVVESINKLKVTP